MIPCKNCITLSICKAYVTQREENFNKHDEFVEDYNEETIYHLLAKCELLFQYLPCDLVYRGFVRKSKDTGMDDWLWYDRVTKVFTFFRAKWSNLF